MNPRNSLSMALAVLLLAAVAALQAASLPATPPPATTPALTPTTATPPSSTTPAPLPAVPIDVARSPAPLFDDPVFHGASDPFVIWNPVKNAWFMYYTQRRATLPRPNGVDWVHGSAIGIATSADGANWKYVGTCQGDHDLSEPLQATTGKGPEPGITWWAPCFLYDAGNGGGTFHMFVSQVDGVYTSWTGQRNIVHFTSADGINWKYLNTCKLSSTRVIDPTVYKVKDTWYMVYKDEADGSRTHISTSKDMVDWANAGVADRDGGQEAPFVFRWKQGWWLIVDAGNNALRVYKSDTGTGEFVYNNTILAGRDGTRPKDNNVGKHPGIVVQNKPDGQEQCVLFYFTHQGNQTVIQVAELELGPDGKVFCNRNQYAKPATASAPATAATPAPAQ
jgi:hypothetical protein